MQIKLDDRSKNALLATFNRLNNNRDRLQLDKLPLELVSDLKDHVRNSLFRLMTDRYFYQKAVNDICKKYHWSSFTFDGGYVTDFVSSGEEDGNM